jgi:hypothetical protein
MNYAGGEIISAIYQIYKIVRDGIGFSGLK